MTFRVLCISHTAVSHAAGRMRYHPFSASPDIDVHLVVPSRWQEFGRVLVADPQTGQGATVHALQARWQNAGPASWYLHHYPELSALAKDLKPDLIHLWEEPWSLVALQAVRLRNRMFPNAPIVMEVDQNISKTLPLPFEIIRRQVLRQTDFVLARSDDAITVVRNSGYIGPASLLGYGVDRSVFRPLDRLQARKRFDISGFTIGYVGRLIAQKGLADAIDAIANAAEPVSLAILGDGPAKSDLEAQAIRLGIADRVRFYPWGTPEQVAQFINALDVLLLLTWTTANVREQFGRVIIEAHGCAVPVIGSTCGSIPDVVGDGGWIVPEHAPERLSKLLDHLMHSPAEIRAAAEAGERQVSQRFSFEVIAKTLSASWNQAYRDRSASFSRQTVSSSSRYRTATRVQE